MLKLTNNAARETRTNPGAARLLSKAGSYFLYLLALLPGLLMLAWVVRFTPTPPFLDEWDLLPTMVKLHTGGFTLNDFWVQHNEHRVVVLRLVALALAVFGGWDTLKETIFGFLMAGLSGLLTWQLLRLTVTGWLRPALLVVCSLLIFSTGQYENWLWGFQLAWFLVNFLLLLAVWATNRWPNTARGFYPALAATFIATFTNGLGLPVWVCVLAGMLGRWRAWRKRYLAGWVTAAAASTGLYFYGYDFIGEHKDVGYILSHLPDVLAYGLAYLATPWAAGLAGMLLSLAGLCGVAAASGYMWWLSYKATPAGTDEEGRRQSWHSILPWLTLVLYVLLNAGITTISRLGLGLEQAQSSRYATIAIWFWAAGFAIITLALHRLWQRRRPALKAAMAGASLVVALGLLTLYGSNYLTGYKLMDLWYKSFNQALPFLYDYPSAPDAALRQIYPSAKQLRDLLWPLDQYNEGIFTPQKRAEYAARQQNALKTMANPAARLFNYPPARMTVSGGDLDKSTLKTGPESLSFTHSGPYPVSITLDVRDFARQTETNSQNRTLFITTNEVWYITIYWYWYTGNELSRVESVLLYPTKDEKGQRIFFITPPPDFQSFKVDLNYGTGRELSEAFKVDMYRQN